MTLTRYTINTSTALASKPASPKSATPAPAPGTAPVPQEPAKGDTVQLDSDGPGAGGGYDGDEVPADDDGPGAGGGYEGVAPDQEPSDSDGPGAGGGYFTVHGLVSATWNAPLAAFVTSETKSTGASLLAHHDYSPYWVESMKPAGYSFAGALPMLLPAPPAPAANLNVAAKAAEEKKA